MKVSSPLATLHTPRQLLATVCERGCRSLSFKGSAILSLSLLTFTAIIYFEIREKAAHEHLEDLGKLTVQAGSNTINYLTSNFSEIEALTEGQAAVAGGVSNNDKVYKSALSRNLDAHHHEIILGSGYWTIPSYPIKHIGFNGKAVGTSLNALFWTHNLFGMLAYDDSYEQSDNYLHSEWFNLAKYAQRGKCAWSRLYIDEKSHERKMTCAVAVRKKNLLKGVASVDINLSDLPVVAKKTAQRIGGGYVFFLDKDGSLIASGGIGDQSIQLNATPSLTALAKRYPAFELVEDAYQAFNRALVYRAKQRLGRDLAIMTDALTGKVPNLPKSVAQIDVALLGDNARLYNNGLSTRYASAHFDSDALLGNEPATAHLFHVPKTFWTMVIVTPDSLALSKADRLADELLIFLLVVTAVLGTLSYVLLEFSILHPVRRTTQGMQRIAELVHEKNYLALKDKKLHVKHTDAVGEMRESVNLLIDRIVENEGKLAEINATLELRVKNRTEALAKALEELKESQTQLIHTERMSLLGQMVAGVTHEFNTPLGYLKSNISICQELLSHYEELLSLNMELKGHLALPDSDNDSDDDAIRLINQITETVNDIKSEQIDEEIKDLFDDTLFGVKQISDLVLDLKNFARLDESKVQAVDIHDCINSALKIANSLLKDADIIKHFDKNLPKVSCAPSQINQILLNLLHNAADAFGDQSDKIIYINTAVKGDDVMISIEDNGHGMSQAVCEQVFEPFFSTKPAGEGTGLGLAICKKIADAHHGRLEVSSMLGEGTCFTLYLPIEYRPISQEQPNNNNG